MLLRILELAARRGRRTGSHPAWMAVSLAVFLVRTHQRRAERETVSLREELRPGESLLITHSPATRG